MGVLFVESIKRLYRDNKISQEKVIELFQNGKINEEEKWRIFNVKLNDSDVETIDKES